MKYIFLLMVVISQLLANVVKLPLHSVDEENDSATVIIEDADVGMSGFIVHGLLDGHSSVLKNIVVVSYDKKSKIATLKMSDFDGLENNSLPEGKWHVEVGDTAILAFAYSRAILLAPSEEIYYRITKGVSVQWIHPDFFATMLSVNGHPTPLKKDFDVMSNSISVGLVFIYLDAKLYTVEARTFKILSIANAPLKQESLQLPFYSRVEHIDSGFWGEGTSKLSEYESYYYELLSKYNKDDKELQARVEKIRFERAEKRRIQKQHDIREGITHAAKKRFR